MSRKTKRFFIIAIYLLIFYYVGYSVWKNFFKEPESCIDGIKNQNEVNVDCGGVCGTVCEEKPAALDMQIQETAVVSGGKDLYDTLVKIQNPNDQYGASSFSYTILLKNAQGSVVTQKDSSGFILPKESKNFIVTNISSSETISSIDVVVKNVQWELFSGYAEKPFLRVIFPRYGPTATGIGFGAVNGTIVNESGFDFRTIGIKVVLRDANKKVLALNTTDMQTVVAGERRDFGPLVWPNSFPGDVVSVEIEPEADVYHSNNFMQRYLPGGKFQSL